MVEDARFEDAHEAPLALRAFTNDDLQVLSSLVQDAIFPATEIAFDRRRRRFALLLNRFRWENVVNGSPERVQSVLAFEDVASVASQGFDRAQADLVLCVLAIEFAAGEDGTGHVELLLAGDGGIRLQVEALEATLRDVTRPYVAPSGRVPDHS